MRDELSEIKRKAETRVLSKMSYQAHLFQDFFLFHFLREFMSNGDLFETKLYILLPFLIAVYILYPYIMKNYQKLHTFASVTRAWHHTTWVEGHAGWEVGRARSPYTTQVAFSERSAVLHHLLDTLMKLFS